jgi:two-component system cell cycle response regulator DivK
MNDSSGKLVMVFEDNELNAKLFRDLLEAQHYRTLHYRDGTNVLNVVREHKPDLIMMDIQLPEVSGIELTRQLKSDPELKSIPVIAVTAFAMKGDEERIRSGGCDAYLSKPISVQQFLNAVKQFLGPTAEPS